MQFRTSFCSRRATTRLPFSTATPRQTRSPRTILTKAQEGGLTGFINSLTVAIQNSPLSNGKKALAIAMAGDYDEVAVKQTIESQTSQEKVLMYSFSGCPFCKKAKAVLDNVGAKYTVYELDQMPDGKAYRAELAKMTGRTSMPNIWIDNQNIGGCNDGSPGLMPLQAQGKLVPMLKAAGAL